MSDESPQPRPRRESLWLKLGAPLAIGILVLIGWEAMVRVNEIPWYILPGPIAIGETLIRDWSMLWPSLIATLRVTALALLVAVVGGLSLAVLFA